MMEQQSSQREQSASPVDGAQKRRSQAALRQQRFRERQALSRSSEQAAKGLPALPSIPSIAGHARWNQALSAAHLLVEQVNQEMQSYGESRSLSWQDSERGEMFSQRQEEVESVLNQLEDLLIAEEVPASKGRK
ncbi:hypothetical protein [Armatimonas sp.]|uniref:hypothetical protein n=1 Tax=Armatimonas sp. TaxID=1872638 RepID=UPI00286AECF0|nr:hypothetical protein [Armatimonas sp.]